MLVALCRLLLNSVNQGDLRKSTFLLRFVQRRAAFAVEKGTLCPRLFDVQNLRPELLKISIERKRGRFHQHTFLNLTLRFSEIPPPDGRSR